jgi:hypothetical protein
MAKTFECERDGVILRGETDDELVAAVQRHIADAHPDLTLSREQILAEVQTKAKVA